jgi:hypothetical protein
MQVQVEIGFEQLLKIIQTLPSGKLLQLKAEIDNRVAASKDNSNLENLLINGPVATEEELAVIEENRHKFVQWREK